jgi:hypothetical protein
LPGGNWWQDAVADIRLASLGEGASRDALKSLERPRPRVEHL